MTLNPPEALSKELAHKFSQVHTIKITGTIRQPVILVDLIPRLPHLKRVHVQGRWPSITLQQLRSLEAVSGNLDDFVIHGFEDWPLDGAQQNLLIQLKHQSRFEITRLHVEGLQHLSEMTPYLNTVRSLEITTPNDDDSDNQSFGSILQPCTMIESLTFVGVDSKILTGIAHEVCFQLSLISSQLTPLT